MTHSFSLLELSWACRIARSKWSEPPPAPCQDHRYSPSFKMELRVWFLGRTRVPVSLVWVDVCCRQHLCLDALPYCYCAMICFSRSFRWLQLDAICKLYLLGFCIKNIQYITYILHTHPSSIRLHKPAKDSFYDLTDKDMAGNEVSMSKFKGEVLCVVNVASKWGLTKSNYVQFSKLYDEYNGKGLRLLAFPCNQFGGQEPVSWGLFFVQYFVYTC